MKTTTAVAVIDTVMMAVAVINDSEADNNDWDDGGRNDVDGSKLR